MKNSAYLQQPQLHQDYIYFVSDDDIWRVHKEGGHAIRLTSSKGKSHSPRISPDGKWMAYLSDDHGQSDIYFISTESAGLPQRLTYKGVRSLCSFVDSDNLVFTSSFESFTDRIGFAYKIDLQTLEISPLNVGPVTTLDQDGQLTVLGVNCGDPARWKRYRGGTAGKLWVKNHKNKKKSFQQILKNLDTNLTNPKILGKRIFFISDHDGVGNIYSCNSLGRDLKQHSFQETYYVRNFSYENSQIAYQAGADIYLLELESGKETKVQIITPSTFNQAQPRFVEATQFLNDYSLNKTASEIAIISRGQIFSFAPWSGASIQYGKKDSRYKMCEFSLKDKNLLYTIEVSPESHSEALYIIHTHNQKIQELPLKKDIGKIIDLKPCPNDHYLAFSNNRNDLFIYDLKKKALLKCSSSPFFFFDSLAWSPCGQFLAYSKATQKNVHELFIFNIKTQKETKLISSILNDFSPTFSPDGNYLFFLGVRDFHPLYSETHFDISFPKATGVYGLALNQKALDLSKHHFDFDVEADLNEEKDKKASSTHIDYHHIEQRVFRLPLELGGYSSLFATKEKLFFTQHSLKPLQPYQKETHDTHENLYTYSFKERKKELFDKDCEVPCFSEDQKYLLYQSGEDLRLVSSEGKPSEDDEFNRKNGWINLDKVKLKIDPKKEWFQMYHEAWLLQKEHFWKKEISSTVNWKKVYKDYLALLDKVHTRSELSDLMWEMQGELGTSHCYEIGGDFYRKPQKQLNASLGATFKYHEKSHSMEITSLNIGDSWIKKFNSPLTAPGVCLDIGDHILGVDGQTLESALSLEEYLEGKANKKVQLKIRRKNQKKAEFVTVYTLTNDILVNYRDWVESNREYIHKKSKGKIGYLHIPDMHVNGYSEFYRHYIRECNYEGLVIDVRYNGGGHVSQLLLKELAQKPLGFDQTRYMGVESYPMYGINGPLVCLTNEHAGSDGDIFSHSFKLLNLGKLIGKRTWGGVIGIWPRHTLADGTVTTQPEFSFWFKDVGFNVENYGTDPDIEVEIKPEDWAQGKDPQLDRALNEVLKDLKKYKALKMKTV